MPDVARKLALVYPRIYKPNRRIEREVHALRSEGFEIHLICRNRDHKPTREILGEGVVLHRLPQSSNEIINRGININTFALNPFWLVTIRRVMRTEGIQIAMVREIGLTLATWLVLPRDGVMLLDMAENIPALIEAVHYQKDVGFQPRSLFFPRWWAKVLEQIGCVLSDGVMVVIEENKERLVRQGIDPDKIEVVSSTPIPEALIPDPEPPDWFDPDPSPPLLTVTYLGYAGPHRGVDTLLEGAAQVHRRHPDLRVVAMGRQQGLEGLVQDLGIEDRVLLPGHVPFRTALYVVQHSDVCVVPHRKSNHVDTTIPNKLFDYMFFGKPVLVSSARPLARIVREERCGLVFRSGDPADLADKLTTLLGDPALRQELGDNGRRAIERRYHWDVDERRFKALIDRAMETVRQRRERAGRGRWASRPHAEGVASMHDANAWNGNQHEPARSSPGAGVRFDG